MDTIQMGVGGTLKLLPPPLHRGGLDIFPGGKFGQNSIDIFCSSDMGGTEFMELIITLVITLAVVLGISACFESIGPDDD